MYRPIAPANHNTVCKFGVGPRNEAHVVKFLPPSCPSRIFPELREAGPPTLNLENIATVLRTKALWHLHCYSLAVVCCGGASERRHWHRFCQYSASSRAWDQSYLHHRQTRRCRGMSIGKYSMPDC